MMLREKYGFKTRKQLELQHLARETEVTLIDPSYKVIPQFF